MGQRIDVNHLNIYYGDFLAVEDVNINIEANKVTAFIGPSGCGKSTVLRTLDRMHEIIPGAHCEGEVLLEGKNLYDKDIDPVAVRVARAVRIRAQKGELKLSDFPMLMHVDDILSHHAPVNIPWEQFTFIQQ